MARREGLVVNVRRVSGNEMAALTAAVDHINYASDELSANLDSLKMMLEDLDESINESLRKVNAEDYWNTYHGHKIRSMIGFVDIMGMRPEDK